MPYETKVTIKPATITPSNIGRIASFNRISIKAATKAPVQAPVPGNGIATKINKPKDLYFFTELLLFSALSSNFFINFTNLVFLSHSKICRINNKINGTGIMLPITQSMYVIGHLKPKAAPAIIPPRSSRTGKIEIMNIISSEGTRSLSDCVKLIIKSSSFIRSFLRSVIRINYSVQLQFLSCSQQDISPTKGVGSIPFRS